MTENCVFIEVKQEFVGCEEITDGEIQDEETSRDQKEFDCADELSTCCLCPKGRILQNQLIDHLKIHLNSDNEQSEKDSYKCCECNVGLAIQLQVINHLLSHLPPQSIKVEEKEEAFIHEVLHDIVTTTSTDDRVVKSKPSYHNQFNRRERSPQTQKIQSEFSQSSDKLFYCNFCRNSYKHKQTVERHLIKEHDPRRKKGKVGAENEKDFSSDQDSKLFYCSICRNGYKHKQTIERHLLKEHNVVVEKNRLKRSLRPANNKEGRKKEKQFICDKCGNLYMFRESLRKHLLRHLNPTNSGKIGRVSREKIVCDKCSKMVDPSVMKRHIQVHHSDYRPFRCEEAGCKTSFFDASKFNDHRNIHLGIRPYICEFCGENFHYASNYRQHKLRHTQPERFKCSVCLSCFVSSKSLRMHMRLHTEDPSAPKQFSCDFVGCEKEFRYLDRLKLHIFNVHRSEPELQCQICSFVSTKRKNHRKHMMKAHNIREGNHPRHRVFPLNVIDS